VKEGDAESRTTQKYGVVGRRAAAALRLVIDALPADPRDSNKTSTSLRGA